ncbi:MAG: bifunctional ADP-heptose synthase [Flavobacteriales bacterium]|nr:bifunctional ADP-heptose synthase [Flavobacteriales bacterium]
MSSIANILHQFQSKKVLVIGDAMIDAYMWGEVNRMSPEAPVPIVEINKRESRLGGAANVALNIQSLGAIPVLFSSIGSDHYGDLFLKLMKEQNLSTEGIQRISNRSTTVKTRIISDNKHVLRVDEEEVSMIRDEKIIECLKNLILTGTFDVIIFEDYNKGLLSEKLIQTAIEIATEKNIPTIVDPKKENFFAYKGVDIFKPNLKEIKEGMDVEFEVQSESELSRYVEILRAKLNAKSILLTLSEHGIYYQNRENIFREKAHKRSIVDVSGAGDTVVSVAALALACQLDSELLMRIANLAGGLVCEKVGVVPILKEDLLKASLQ